MNNKERAILEKVCFAIIIIVITVFIMVYFKPNETYTKSEYKDATSEAYSKGYDDCYKQIKAAGIDSDSIYFSKESIENVLDDSSLSKKAQSNIVGALESSDKLILTDKINSEADPQSAGYPSADD